MAIIGYIDRFDSPDLISGWVGTRTPPESLTPEIAVECPKNISVVINSGIVRHDLASVSENARGFSLRLSHPVSSLDLLSGSFSVIAIARGEKKRLDFDQFLRARLTILAIEFLAKSLPKRNDKLWSFHLKAAAKAAAVGASGPLKAFLTFTNTDVSTAQSAPTIPAHSIDTPSPVFFRPGLISGDGSATLGPDGNLFLTGGTNNVLSQYNIDPEAPTLIKTTQEWLDLIRSRKTRIESTGPTYFQVIIPDKISIVKGAPLDKDNRVSPLLARIEKEIANQEISENYISIREKYTDHDSSAIFRRLDTHLSPYGGHITASSILQAIGENAIDPGEPLASLWTSGDLAERFFGCPLYESVKIYPENQLTKSRQLIHSKLEPGKHIGREYTWENNAAPHDKKVLAFGNSFMDGARNQGSISQWLSQYFSLYKFVFSPSVNYDIIDEFKPDIVICQTIERFLWSVPQT